MGRCEDFVEFLRRNAVTRNPMKRAEDPYSLAGDLLRAFESLRRNKGLDPNEHRQQFLERILAEIVRFYSSKRIGTIPSWNDLRRASEFILSQIASMESVQREICLLYFELKAQGKSDLEDLLRLSTRI